MVKLSKPQKTMLSMMAGKYIRNYSKRCGNYVPYSDLNEGHGFNLHLYISLCLSEHTATKIARGAIIDFSRHDSRVFSKSTITALLDRKFISTSDCGFYYSITELGRNELNEELSGAEYWEDVE